MIIKIGPKRHERFQLKNPFVVRELAGANEDVKRPHRQKVAEFFASYQKHRRPVCFCLPGVRWSFEHELQDRLDQPARFVGVERNYTILEKGLPHTPGDHVLYEEEPGETEPYRMFTTTRSRVVWCDCSRLLDPRWSRRRSTSKTNRWRHLFKGWTCAWLDFSAPISIETVRCCKRLENHLELNIRTVPVAVTFMVGREDAETHKLIRLISPDADHVAARARFLLACFQGNNYRTAEPVESWGYKSAGGVTMGVATFLFVDKTGRTDPAPPTGV